MYNVVIIGIKHNKQYSFKKVNKIINTLEKEKILILLEYDKIRYNKNLSREKRASFLRKLLGIPIKHFDEFYQIIKYLQEKGHNFRYIDTLGIKLAKQFYRKTSIKNLIKFSSAKKKELKKDILFNEYFIEKREKAMTEEIGKFCSRENIKRIYIIMGSDHIISMKKRLLSKGIKCTIL